MTEGKDMPQRNCTNGTTYLLPADLYDELVEILDSSHSGSGGIVVRQGENTGTFTSTVWTIGGAGICAAQPEISRNVPMYFAKVKKAPV